MALTNSEGEGEREDHKHTIKMKQSYKILSLWTWELLSGILAIGLLIAIAVLLASYDGKPAPDWGYRLNLNALLALLSTALRAFLVMIVSQIICQKKWEWYGAERARPLHDLQRFDAGSRGSLGALFLIPRILFRDTISLLSAFILLVSFLVGPFVQQASRTMPCAYSVPDANASIPTAHYVPRRGGYYSPLYSNHGTPRPETIVAVLSSVTAPNSLENQVRGSCTTGACLFDDGDPIMSAFPHDSRSSYSTVGVCNKCIDVASLVVVKQTNISGENQYILPNGFNISVLPGQMTRADIRPSPDLNWLGAKLTPELEAMSRWAYANATFLARKDGINTTTAAACVVYPCLRTYIGSITDNKLIERHLSSAVMKVDMTNRLVPGAKNMGQFDTALHNPYYNYATVKSPCAINGTIYDLSHNMSSYPNATNLALFDLTYLGSESFTLLDRNITRKKHLYHYTLHNITAPEQCIYRQNAAFTMSISAILHADVFTGFCLGDPLCYQPISPGLMTAMGSFSTLGVQSVLTALTTGTMTFQHVDSWFSSFSSALTNRIRAEFGAERFVDTFDNTELDLPVGEFRGVAWRQRECVHVFKEWFVLPLGLTLSTVVLVVWTIADNWRQMHGRPVWKDSLLPLLFYGRKFETSGEGAHLSSANNDSNRATLEDEGHLMGTHEMNAKSKSMAVTFYWPGAAEMNNDERSTSPALREEKSWLRHRRAREVSTSSLLDRAEERSS